TAGALITYVSAQLGHANPTTTLRYYAKWIPTKGQRWVIVLDRVGSSLEPKSGTKGVIAHVGGSEVGEKVGTPGRARTCDILINSPTQDLRTTGHDDVNTRDSEGW